MIDDQSTKWSLNSLRREETYLPERTLPRIPSPELDLWRTARAGLVVELRTDFDLSYKLARQAVADAEAIAAQTELPWLFLPTLAVEKAVALADWQRHQRELFQRTALSWNE